MAGNVEALVSCVNVHVYSGVGSSLLTGVMAFMLVSCRRTQAEVRMHADSPALGTACTCSFCGGTSALSCFVIGT